MPIIIEMLRKSKLCLFSPINSVKSPIVNINIAVCQPVYTPEIIYSSSSLLPDCGAIFAAITSGCGYRYTRPNISHSIAM